MLLIVPLFPRSFYFATDACAFVCPVVLWFWLPVHYETTAHQLGAWTPPINRLYADGSIRSAPAAENHGNISAPNNDQRCSRFDGEDSNFAEGDASKVGAEHPRRR